MFDDTGNKHCVYITYIVYTDDGDQECNNRQQTVDSMDAVPGSYIESSRKTKVIGNDGNAINEQNCKQCRVT